MPRTLTIYQPGTVDYEPALAFQRTVAEEYARTGEDTGALILLEHPAIITIGRSGTDDNILASPDTVADAGVAVSQTNRGGDVTYHGPGQIVGYPILPLVFHGKDVHAYLRRIEAFLIAMLRGYGIAADRKPGFTGVWTPQGKIVSIGVAVSHWIAYHGFALNVAPNLDHFNLIRPCGLTDVEIISMEKLLGHPPDMAEVRERVITHFCAEFKFDETHTLHHLQKD